MSEPRTVIVTGGSRGLGAGLVQAYLDAGDRVATCARTSTPAVEAWNSDITTADRFHFAPADLSDADSAREFVRAVETKWGPIDVLVNNAGVARDGVIALFSDDDADAVIDLNLRGTFAVTKAAVRSMLKHGSGRIVNVSSIVGLTGYRGLAVYSATKAALDGFTRSLARELGSRGIIVNGVAPGYLNTEMSHGLDESNLAQIVRRTPAGRLGDPEDVARAVLFLTASEQTFISGQVLVVDGGLTC